MQLAEVNLSLFRWPQFTKVGSGFGFSNHVDAVLPVLVLDNGPVRVIRANRRWDEELGR